MVLTMTEQLVILVIVVFVLVLLDGLRRKWSDRRDRVVLKIDKTLPRVEIPDDELFTPELPNGGARTLPRDTDAIVRPAKPAPKLKSLQKRREQLRPENVPVLLDTVEVEEEQIEHTNVFADSSSTPAGEAADYAVEMEEETMGMYEEEIEEFIDGLEAESSVVSKVRSQAKGKDGDEDEEWDDEWEPVEDDEEDDEEEDEEDEEEPWEETWEDDSDDDDDEEADEEDDEDDKDDDYEDDDDDFEDDDDDDDAEDDDEDQFPDEFGDYEDEDEASNKVVVESRRVEPAFGKDELDTYEFEGHYEPNFEDESSVEAVAAHGKAGAIPRKPPFGAGFLSKKDQGELFREEPVNNTASAQLAAASSPQEVIIINVMARAGTVFEGYDLLPVLQLQGMRLGDMSIFHKHSGSNSSGTIIFSMANMVKPGSFDLATMENFTTPGVSFFLQLPNKYGNMASFDQMLTAANALKHALDAELKDENRSVLTRQTLEHYRQRIRDFELKMLSRK